MKATLILDISVKGANVWVMKATHEESKMSCSFWSTRIFESEDEARECMIKEVQKIGMNIYHMWCAKHPRTTRYHFFIDPEGYDCETDILIGGEVVDKFYGQLKCLTIE